MPRMALKRYYSHSVSPDAESPTHSHLNPSRHTFPSLMDKLHII